MPADDPIRELGHWIYEARAEGIPLRVRPEAIELWSEADDRIHERRLFEREGGGWKLTLLAP